MELLEGYIARLEGEGLAGWQICQAIDAFRIAVSQVMNLEWGKRADWDGWKGRMRQVEENHPSRLRREIDQVLENLVDPWRLAAELMYGSGMRVSECMRLRLKDLDFDRGQIVLRETKGGKERVVPSPERECGVRWTGNWGLSLNGTSLRPIVPDSLSGSGSLSTIDNRLVL